MQLSDKIRMRYPTEKSPPKAALSLSQNGLKAQSLLNAILKLNFCKQLHPIKLLIRLFSKQLDAAKLYLLKKAFT